MQKLFLTLLIAASTMTSFRAAAQTGPTPTMAYELYFFNDEASAFQITNFTYNVLSSQKPSIFGTPYTFPVSNSTTEPVGQFDFGGYWFTPSSTQPLTISTSSSTANVKNLSGVSQSFKLGIEFAPTRSFEPPTVIFGTPVTIPAGQTMTLSFPSGSTTYNNGALISLFPSEPNPVPLAFFISAN